MAAGERRAKRDRIVAHCLKAHQRPISVKVLRTLEQVQEFHRIAHKYDKDHPYEDDPKD